MNNEKNINNNFNKEEFFQVYPPLTKIVNSSESNKFIKLFAKPIKRGILNKKSRNIQNQNNISRSLNKQNLELIEESLNESHKMFSSKNSFISNTIKNKENAIDTKTKFDNFSNLEFSNEKTWAII